MDGSKFIEVFIKEINDGKNTISYNKNSLLNINSIKNISNENKLISIDYIHLNQIIVLYCNTKYSTIKTKLKRLGVLI